MNERAMQHHLLRERETRLRLEKPVSDYRKESSENNVPHFWQHPLWLLCFFDQTLWLLFLSLHIFVRLLFERGYHSRVVFIFFEKPADINNDWWRLFLAVLLSAVETSHNINSSSVSLVTVFRIICILVHVHALSRRSYYSRVVSTVDRENSFTVKIISQPWPTAKF